MSYGQNLLDMMDDLSGYPGFEWNWTRLGVGRVQAKEYLGSSTVLHVKNFSYVPKPTPGLSIEFHLHQPGYTFPSILVELAFRYSRRIYSLCWSTIRYVGIGIGILDIGCFRISQDQQFFETDHDQRYYPAECDSISSSYLLRCISPLLQSDRYRLHPPLYLNSRWRRSDNDTQVDEKDICDVYSEYQSCAPQELRHRCRTLVAHDEAVYEYICADRELRKNLTSEWACLAKLDVDIAVTTCERNAAVALRHVASTSAVSIDRRRSMQCDVVQKYVDCVRTKYSKECGEDVWLIKGEALELATTVGEMRCNFTLLEPKVPVIDYSKPICKPNSTCSCRPGFEFDSHDSNLCIDTNECSQLTDSCSQRCENTIGSYICSCDERYYELAADGRGCVLKSKGEKPFIFFAHGQSLWNISMDGKDFQLQRAGLQKTAMLDIDAADKMLYYVDIGANKLERIRFEGVFPQTLQSFDLEGTEGLGVDWVGKKLYSVKGQNIYVQELDGRFRRTLYRDVFKLPRALAVHAPLGLCYATDWGANAFIAKAAMDGSDFRRIITSGLVWPNGLTIDYYGEKLYWADAFLDVIECSKLDGSQRKTVLHDTNSAPHPFGLAIMGDHVYWTDWTYRGILRADKNTGENVTVIAQTALLPYGIKVYYSAMQPKAENPCGTNNGGCSQLCLISPTTTALDALVNSSINGSSSRLNFTCACADGFQLDADGRTCVSRCTNKEILCQGADPKCISKVYWCDGVVHCRDNADETECAPRMCFASEFQCHANKTCIGTSKICDGTKNCDDGSDEIYC